MCQHHHKKEEGLAMAIPYIPAFIRTQQSTVCRAAAHLSVVDVPEESPCSVVHKYGVVVPYRDPVEVPLVPGVRLGSQ